MYLYLHYLQSDRSKPKPMLMCVDNVMFYKEKKHTMVRLLGSDNPIMITETLTEVANLISNGGLLVVNMDTLKADLDLNEDTDGLVGKVV